MKYTFNLSHTQWFQLATKLAISKSIALNNSLLKYEQWMQNNFTKQHIGLNDFAFGNLPIIAQAKTIHIFHNYKPSCWKPSLWTESITCPQLNILISNHVIQQNTSDQPMIAGCALDSSPVAGHCWKWKSNCPAHIFDLSSAFLLFTQ